MSVNDRIAPTGDRLNMIVGKLEVLCAGGRAISTAWETAEDETAAILPEWTEYANEAPEIRQAMREIETARFGGLEDRLLELADESVHRRHVGVFESHSIRLWKSLRQ